MNAAWRWRAGLLSAGVIAAVALAPAPSSSAATGAPRVTTDHGQLAGTRTAFGEQFLGIPYAAPPTGSRRWRPPQPAAPWPGVREATTAGAQCAQPEDDLLAKAATFAEDCLYLNVYAPPGGATGLPVMVWLHGGAFYSGAGSDYDGSHLAARGHVVVVTVNYRLGVLGFLAHPALAASPGGDTGNYGLLDQLAALRWVRANAAAFGGSGGNVTVFGQSAGGVSICDLLVSPAARGLFQKAIIESGPCAAQSALTQASGNALGEVVAARLGCADPATAANCLRGKSTRELVDATGYLPGESLLSQALEVFSGWDPVTGTSVLPAAPMDAFAAGDEARVPILIGTTRDETTPFIDLTTQTGIPVDWLTYAAFVGVYASNPWPVLQAYSPAAVGGDARLAMSGVITDSQFSCPAATIATETGAWQYEFSDRSVPDLYGLPQTMPYGAYHASEISFVFGTGGTVTASGRLIPFTAAESRLSGQMLTAWTSFARTGNPGWARTPGVTHVFDLTGSGDRTGFGAEHDCGLWSGERLLVP